MKLKKSSPVCEYCGYDEGCQNSNHQLPVGTVVGGQYILGRVLGQGGFGITYIAYDRILEQPVAVKEYFPSGYAGRDTRTPTHVTSYDNGSVHAFESNKQRFLRESESLAKLWDIPQIVRILRHFEENGTAYIAMEYVEGVNLREFLKQKGRPLTMEELLDILGPVILALEHVHKAELVHRDISPDNIMVLPNGSSKLLDFGAARYVENADAEKERNTSTQTILKHGFAPPEQYRSHGALGPWTDIYAMCATVYYCLSGRIPPESMSRIMDDTPLGVDRIPGLTQQQKEALEKGMELKPKDRIKSPEELYEALFSGVISARGKLPQAEQVHKDREEAACALEKKKAPGTKKKTVGILAAAAVTLLVAGIAAKRMTGSEPSPQLSTEPTVITEAGTETMIPEPSPATLEISQELNLELDTQELGATRKISVLSVRDDSKITWSTSNPGVAAVSEEGIVTAVGYGIAQITASCEGKEASCQVYIFRKANIELELGGNASTRKLTGAVPNEVILPGVIDGTVIKRIGPNTLESCQNVVRIVIPDMVEAIEKNAFNGCSSLNQVVFPQRLTRIGTAAFANSGLTEVVVPEGVTKLEWGAFHWSTNLRSVVLPESLTMMEDAVFYHCTSLTEVNIPDGITSIGVDTFFECSSLREISIPDSVNKIGSRAFCACKQLKTVKLPEGLLFISPNLFENCEALETIVLPNSTSVIQEGAFAGCRSLSQVTIPPNVMRIEANAFGRCFNLKSVTISESCQVADGAIPPGCTINYY